MSDNIGLPALARQRERILAGPETIRRDRPAGRVEKLENEP